MRKLLIAVAVLAVGLAGCVLPGLGTLEPLSVHVETPHIATVTFTPAQVVQDVSIYVGGADIVRADHPLFECEEYRNGHSCYVPGQEDPANPRVTHPAGESIKLVAYAQDSSGVTANVNYRPQ